MHSCLTVRCLTHHGLCSPVANKEADTLPYDGRHILEIWGFSSSTSHSLLDSYVQGLNSHTIGASLRYDA